MMSARKQLLAEAKKRILMTDGAFGTQIQERKLSEEDYAGDLGLKADQKGNNDILALTRPDVIRDITRAYLDAGSDDAAIEDGRTPREPNRSRFDAFPVLRRR